MRCGAFVGEQNEHVGLSKKLTHLSASWKWLVASRQQAHTKDQVRKNIFGQLFFHLAKLVRVTRYSGQKRGSVPWPYFKLPCSQKWARLLCSPHSAWLSSRSAVLNHHSARTLLELSLESEN